MIKIQWLASIWRQNDQKCWVTSQNIQNNAKLQNRSNYNELHRLDVKTIKTKQNYKTDQITMNCIDWMSKLSKQSKTTKVINIQRLASIWRQNDQKCWVTSQNIQNNAKLQNRSNYNELHRLDVRTIKTMLNYKSDLDYKSDLNYKSDQNPMTCNDWISKWSKQI